MGDSSSTPCTQISVPAAAQRVRHHRQRRTSTDPLRTALIHSHVYLSNGRAARSLSSRARSGGMAWGMSEGRLGGTTGGTREGTTGGSYRGRLRGIAAIGFLRREAVPRFNGPAPDRSPVGVAELLQALECGGRPVAPPGQSRRRSCSAGDVDQPTFITGPIGARQMTSTRKVWPFDFRDCGPVI